MIGNILRLHLKDAVHPNLLYILALSLGTSPGIPLSDGRVIPLNPDGLLFISIDPTLALSIGLNNTQGLLNASGEADAYWTIPLIPQAAGLTVYTGFVVINTSLSGEASIVSISDATPITLLGPDITPPLITIVSPANGSSSENATHLLQVTANEPINTWWYSLNNGPNVTFIPTITITGILGQNVLTVFANDTTGNVGSSTNMFAVLPDTTPPSVTIFSPTNTTYNTTTINLNVGANEQISTWWYRLNNGPNVTFQPNTTITAQNSVNSLVVYAQDLAGNVGSATRVFTVILDTTPPQITIFSPLNNSIYNTLTLPLQVGANEQIQTWIYSINNGPNITFIPNSTITGSLGPNMLTVYAIDLSVNTGVAMRVFTIILPPNWTNDTRLTDSPALAESPSLTSDLNGNIHIVWADSRPGLYEVFYKQLNNSGVNVTSDMRITFGFGGAYNSVLAPDHLGNMHVAWQDTRNAPYTGEIYYEKLNNNGVNVTPEIRLTNQVNSSLNPAIGTNPAGNVFVAWVDTRDGNTEIYYEKLSSGGGTLTNDRRVTNNSASSLDPAISVDPFGNVHFVWVDTRDGNDEIYYRKLAPNGTFITADVSLTVDSAVSYYPALSTDANGNAHVVWSDARHGATEIYYKIVFANLTVSPDIRITNAPQPSWRPTISTSQNGNVQISWMDYRDGNQELYYTQLNNNSLTLVDDQRLTFDPNSRTGPSLDTDPANNAHVTWFDYRHGSPEIYYMRSL